MATNGAWTESCASKHVALTITDQGNGRHAPKINSFFPIPGEQIVFFKVEVTSSADSPSLVGLQLPLNMSNKCLCFLGSLTLSSYFVFKECTTKVLELHKDCVVFRSGLNYGQTVLF